MPVDLERIRDARARIVAPYRGDLRPPVELKRPEKPAGPVGDRLAVLASIHSSPFLSVNARAEVLHLSTSALRRIMDGLEAMGWLQFVQFSYPKRGFVRYCNITQSGLEAAQLAMPSAGSGSFLHRRLQERVTEHLRCRGLTARIEFTLNGKRADVAYPKGESWVAVEVGLSDAEGEHSNIIKNRAAGFAEVHALLRESPMLQEVRRLLHERPPKEPANVNLDLITNYLRSLESSTEEAA
jgi:DNA-binding MarR family transcriptional regulator